MDISGEARSVDPVGESLKVGRIAVTGSVATDHLMTFPGRFSEALIPEKLTRSRCRSWWTTSRCVAEGSAPTSPSDSECWGSGRCWSRRSVTTSTTTARGWGGTASTPTASASATTHHTARFVCTTDPDQNQIASFYPGAMTAARDIELGPVLERAGGVGMVIVGADDPTAMLNHTNECRQRGLPFAADPSQQLSSLSGDDTRSAHQRCHGALQQRVRVGADRAAHRVGLRRRCSTAWRSA